MLPLQNKMYIELLTNANLPPIVLLGVHNLLSNATWHLFFDSSNAVNLISPIFERKLFHYPRQILHCASYISQDSAEL